MKLPTGIPVNSKAPVRLVVICSTPVCSDDCGGKRSVTIACAAGVNPSGRSTRPAMLPDGPSRIVVVAVSPGAAMTPLLTPPTVPASPVAKNVPTGTFWNVTTPEALLKPLSSVARAPGESPGAAALARSLTCALGTTVTPSAATTVTATDPAPRNVTVTSFVASSVVTSAVAWPPFPLLASDRPTTL